MEHMLDDSFILLLKTRMEKASYPAREDLRYLIETWDEVKDAVDIDVSSCTPDSPRIIGEYISEALVDGWYDYRSDPWYGYCGSYNGGREENSLRLRLLDAEDMAHDLAVLADDVRESFGISFSTVRETGEMSRLFKVLSLSEILSPSMFDRTTLVSFIRSLESLEALSVEVKRKRDCILEYYTEDVFKVGKDFWKDTIPHDSHEYSEDLARVEESKRNGKRLEKGELEALTGLMSDYRKARKNYRAKEAEISPSFSSYSGWKTDWKGVAEDIESVLAVVVPNRDYGKLAGEKCEDWIEVRKKAFVFYSGINAIWEKYNSSFEALLSDWDSKASDLRNIGFSALEERFRSAGENTSMKYRWKSVDPVIREAKKDGTILFIDEVLSRRLSSDEIFPAFYKALVKKAISSIYSSDTELEALMEKKEEEKSGREKASDGDFMLYSPLDLRKEAASSGVDSFSSASFGAFIKSVVDVEAPVFERDLAKRLSFLGGEEYLTPEVMESYRKAMKELDGTSFVRRNGFVYSTQERTYPFRKASLMRDFSHIAPEEIRSGMLSLIRRNGKIGKSELYNLLGSYCGYSVVLKSRYAELDRILMSLSDEITIDGEYVAAGGEE